MVDRAYRIVVINPGSTSTKLASYENEKPVWTCDIGYSAEQLAPFHHSIDQLELRKRDIENVLQGKNTAVPFLDAIAVRGGPFKPLEGGTYRITEAVLQDVRQGNVMADHVSNLGVLLAEEIASRGHCPAFFVDPVSVDEFEPLARISGIPELERKSLFHALNIKASARCLARDLGRVFEDMQLIAAHLGGGISICAIRQGRIIDVNNANEEGPFSPERAGTLPVSSLAKLCYSGKFAYAEMKCKLVGMAGLSAYLGTNDAREVERRIQAGDKKAEQVYEAMAYQIAKEVGAMATVLHGQLDAILFTGGLSYSTVLMGWIKRRVSFLAPIYVFEGEREMEALALGVLRILRGEEKEKRY